MVNNVWELEIETGGYIGMVVGIRLIAADTPEEAQTISDAHPSYYTWYNPKMVAGLRAVNKGMLLEKVWEE